jgi:hypothetical protein
MTGHALNARFMAAQLGWPGWVGVAALLLGLAGLLVAAPQIERANGASAADIASLQQRLLQLRDPRRAQAAREPLAALVASLPPASEVPDFVAAIQRRAEDGAVQIDRTEYRVQPVLGHAAQRYRLSFPANADYPHLRNWLEALLHDYPNLLLDELSLRRAVDGGEELEAHVSVSFLVRGGR